MTYKIAIVSSSAPPRLAGGISTAHWNLYLALKKSGYTVKVFTFEENGFNGQEDGDVVRHGSSAAWRLLIRVISRLYMIAMRLIEGRVNAAFQLTTVIYTMMGARRLNRSLNIFHPDVVILPDHGAPGYFITLPDGCRTIFVSHNNCLRFINEPLIGNFSPIDAKMAMYFEHKTMSRVDAVICPSRYMKDIFELTHKFLGSVNVIPNIVEQDFIFSIPATDMHQLLDIPSDSPVIYIPSAGSKNKGVRYLFEIIRRLSSSSKRIGFYLTGTIEDNALLKELKHVPENAQLYCPGNVDYAANISMIKGCTLCVSPTLIESFGMAILEANFCGLPVVSFNAGGNADIITDGVNGYLVPLLDVEALISRAIQLLDKELCAEMKSKMLLLVNEQFASGKIARQFIDQLELQGAA